MESKSLEVNDNEVPLKTNHKSNNGLEVSQQQVENPSNPELGSTDDPKASPDTPQTKDESEANDGPHKHESVADGSRHQYSKEQLIQISKLSLARIRPKCLDSAFNNSGNNLWNPEKWINSRSPVANTSNKYNYNKRPTNDLKDRVLEEENDIILSPQRGSFGTGCHVSSNSFGTNRPTNDSRSRDHYSERNKMDESNDGSHRSNINTRRVGSGRIVAKERTNDWSDRGYDRTYEHRDTRDGRDNRDRTDDYNDRRNTRYERRPNRDMNSNRNGRYEQRYREHKYSRDEEENEPEWFTEGPTSKHDTIELKGFDDDSMSDINLKQSKDMAEDKSKDGGNNESKIANQMNLEPNVKDREKELKKNEDFDVNAMFKSEEWFTAKEYQTPENKMISSVVGISENVSNETDINVKSRSKRWFKETPNQAIGSMTSELSDFSQTNENVLKNRQKESLTTPSMVRPQNTQMSNPLSPDRIFQMLSNGSNRMSIEQMSHQKLDPTKAMSVAEIEANMSQMDVNNGQNEDKRAFDKLIFDLNKKSVQNLSEERAHNEMKGGITLMQTPDAHVIIPKSMRIAPSILELLKEQENKEAMADLHRSNRRVVPNHPNGINIPQNSVNNLMFGSQTLTNAGPNPMEVQSWQNSASMTKTVRPSRSPSSQEMSDQTAIMLQKALQTRQQIGPVVRSQSQVDTIRTNTPNRSASNFLIPTSVMRNMHSEKERDSIKSVFNDMTSESNSSQYKFPNENMISKPSPMRPIVKSNNPIGQSMIAKQSPLSPHSESMAFSANNLVGIQSHLFLPQQAVQQNSSPVNSYQRSISSSNSNIRPFSLGQNSLTRTSTPSPSAVNNMAMNSNILQMFNNPNVRTNVNQMQMNQMMALQHNSTSDGRQSQYSQSRPITAANVQQMLFNNTSKSDPFNSFDRNMMSESEKLKTSVPTTYSQPRPQMQQMFPSAGPHQPNRSTESRFFGQIFGQEAVHHSLSELPTVPLHNALTLDDIERP